MCKWGNKAEHEMSVEVAPVQLSWTGHSTIPAARQVSGWNFKHIAEKKIA